MNPDISNFSPFHLFFIFYLGHIYPISIFLFLARISLTISRARSMYCEGKRGPRGRAGHDADADRDDGAAAGRARWDWNHVEGGGEGGARSGISCRLPPPVFDWVG